MRVEADLCGVEGNSLNHCYVWQMVGVEVGQRECVKCVDALPSL